MQTRRLALPAAAALAALLLAGCSGPAEPAWTPPPASPEPSASANVGAPAEPPVDEDAAWSAATAAIDEYLVAQSNVYAEPGELGPLEPLVTTSFLEEWRSSAATIAEQGRDYSGSIVARYSAEQSQSGEARFADVAVPYGSYTVRGCQDATALIADGFDIQPFPAEWSVVFDPNRGGWLVDGSAGLDDTEWGSLC